MSIFDVVKTNDDGLLSGLQSSKSAGLRIGRRARTFASRNRRLVVRSLMTVLVTALNDLQIMFADAVLLRFAYLVIRRSSLCVVFLDRPVRGLSL